MCKRNHLVEPIASEATMASKGMVAGTAESARQEHRLGGRENMLGMVHVFKPQSPQPVMHLPQKCRAFSCFQNSSTNDRPGIQML